MTSGSRIARRILRLLLPSGTGSAALDDLEREVELRRATHPRWAEPFWLLRHGIPIAIGLRLGALVRALPRSAAGLGVELRLIVKGLGRSPGLTAASVLVIALGVAAPTATYSVIRAITRGLPLPDPDQLVTVANWSPPSIRRTAPPSLTRDQLRMLRENSGHVGPVAAYRAEAWDLGSEGLQPERVSGAAVTYDLLKVLGEQPEQGRGLTADDQGEAVAMVGHRLWRERFARDPRLVGSSIRLNGAPHTVVGVLPDNVRLPDGAQIWSLLDLRAPSASGFDAARFTPVARLPEGLTVERASEQLRDAVVDVPVPWTPEPGARLLVTSLGGRLGVWGADSPMRPFLIGMLTIVSCLLLVAVSNVANLFLCRAIARQSEVAVRSALGASRGRLILHHLFESSVVAIAGGLLGVALAVRAGAFFRVAGAEEFEWWMELEVDPAMLIFALTLTTVAALAAGLIPALQATSRKSSFRGNAPGGGGFRLSRSSQILVVTEVMFSVALLVPATLIVRQVFSQQQVGDVDGRRILVGGYSLRREQGFSDADVVEWLGFHRTLLERVRPKSGVAAAAFISPFPGKNSGSWIDVAPEGSLADSASTHLVVVTPGAFDLVGAPLLRGRDLTWSDGDTDPPAIVVNEAFASRFFPGEDPLGRRVRLTRPTAGPFVGLVSSIEATVVGLAPPIATYVSETRLGDALYLPLTMVVPDDAFVMLRASGDAGPLSVLPQLRAALAELDPDEPLEPVGTLASLARNERRLFHALVGMSVGVGLAGLLMSLTGLYAIVAFTVTRRTREVGIRMALGASSARVVWAMLEEAAVQLAQGLVLGLALTLMMAPVVQALSAARERSYGVHLAVGALLLSAGLIAAAVPALRAVRIEPTAALRAE